MSRPTAFTGVPLGPGGCEKGHFLAGCKMKTLRDGSNECFHSNQLILSPQYQTTWGMRQFFGQLRPQEFPRGQGSATAGKVFGLCRRNRYVQLPVYPKDFMVSFGWLPSSIDLYFGSANMVALGLICSVRRQHLALFEGHCDSSRNRRFQRYHLLIHSADYVLCGANMSFCSSTVNLVSLEH